MKIRLTEPLIVCQVTYEIGKQFILTIDGERKMLSTKEFDLIVIGTEIKYEILN